MNSGRAPRRRANRPLRVFLPLAVVAAALVLSACSSAGTSGGGGDTNFVSSTGGIETVARAERKPPNDLAGETLDGKKLDVAALKGKVVVLNVWGSWCAPCRAEASHFAKVAKDTQGKGVAFVGINTRDSQKKQAIAFETEYGVTYPSLYDPDGRIILHGFPRGTATPQGIPYTIVLDRDGKIAARALMALDEEKLRTMIDPLIAEK